MSVFPDPPKETEREKGRKEGVGAFYNMPQYSKLYDVLKAAYSSCKVGGYIFNTRVTNLM